MKGWVLMAGGGTGGHLFPALAVASVLKRLEPGLAIAFVSAGRALETRVLARAGYPLEALPVQALRGRGLVGRVRTLAGLPSAVGAAKGLLRDYDPRLVLAVGGYASFPLGVAAWLSGVPLAVQEQNAVPGLTNRQLSRFAREIFIAFPAAREHFPAEKTTLAGNPVRPEVMTSAQEVVRDDPTERFTVLVLGGSQGAASLNRALREALPLLSSERRRLHIIHQTGAREELIMRSAYDEAGISAEVSGFIEDMGQAYGRAHLVICRSGAGTLTEVMACGRAAVCVPYPFAAGDHQTANARALMEAGGGLMIPDEEINGLRVAGTIRELAGEPRRLAAMEEASLAQALPEAAMTIAQACLEMMAPQDDQRKRA